ncbi:hypothetical protein [Labedella endophytica]|jgi:hypothetical protein|uniref:Uncharacterized protein n=1 Tax=Labedella endophytica TaxID=1523160 RepID=A0A3S0VDX7_9MICO|nr:hypothetical protein [Labedella endophytica]RUQ98033.1 hypothetical protein ELQ94_13430 [Labedella endophytica]
MTTLLALPVPSLTSEPLERGLSLDMLAQSGADNLLPLVAFGIATVLLGGLAVLIAARHRRGR